jgi:hypothetical protein
MLPTLLPMLATSGEPFDSRCRLSLVELVAAKLLDEALDFRVAVSDSASTDERQHQ